MTKGKIPEEQKTTTPTTSNQIVSLPIKEIIGIIVFFLTLGIAIGGYISILNDFNKMDSKLKDINTEINNSKIIIEGMKEKVEYLSKSIEEVKKLNEVQNQLVVDVEILKRR